MMVIDSKAPLTLASPTASSGSRNTVNASAAVTSQPRTPASAAPHRRSTMRCSSSTSGAKEISQSQMFGSSVMRGHLSQRSSVLLVVQ